MGSGSDFNKYSLMLVGIKLLNYFYKLDTKSPIDSIFFISTQIRN